MAENSVRVICGPTAAGKSAIALGLAMHHGATIISADSRQIYRGFDVGTAKPSPDERCAVRHEGLDVAEPGERYSAALWATAATRWIEAALARGSVPIVVGGTGFYIRALFDPIFSAPAVDELRRTSLEHFLGQLETVELRRWCGLLDPARAHLGRVQLTRAIETALLAGRRLSVLHSLSGIAPRFKARYLVVDPGAGLASRIESRFDSMLASGWLDEVRRLVATVPSDAPAWKASGYRAMRDFAAGTAGLSTVRERIIIETRQYAKRQRTWFRHQLEPAYVTQVNPDDSNRPATIDRWWKESE